MLKKIRYRGWNNCYKLSNEVVSIIVNAEAGGRVMTFERKGLNIVYENRDQDGKTLEDYKGELFDPDGARFDYGPERKTEKNHSLTYMGPYDLENSNPYSITIKSQADKQLGIISYRKFELDEFSEKLKITQLMKNISSVQQEYFFWGRTLVRAGGKLFMPVNPNSANPDKWGRYIWGEPDRFTSDPLDTGVKIEEGIFILPTEAAKNAKYGVDSEDGWMAYGIDGLLFVKDYAFFKDLSYGEEFGQTNIFYISKSKFAEMEPISPMVSLKPGEEYSYTEDWYLFDYPPSKDLDFDVSEARTFFKTRIADGSN